MAGLSKGLYQGWGEKDYQDALAGVERAIELGYADPDRLGMGGYSYGGNKDWNVPIQGSEQLYQVMRRVGVV